VKDAHENLHEHNEDNKLVQTGDGEAP